MTQESDYAAWWLKDLDGRNRARMRIVERSDKEAALELQTHGAIRARRGFRLQ